MKLSKRKILHQQDYQERNSREGKREEGGLKETITTCFTYVICYRCRLSANQYVNQSCQCWGWAWAYGRFPGEAPGTRAEKTAQWRTIYSDGLYWHLTKSWKLCEEVSQWCSRHQPQGLISWNLFSSYRGVVQAQEALSPSVHLFACSLICSFSWWSNNSWPQKIYYLEHWQIIINANNTNAEGNLGWEEISAFWILFFFFFAGPF